MSSFLSTRLEFETCLQNFYNEVKSCSDESSEWAWKIQPVLKHAYIQRKSFTIATTIPASVEEDLSVIEESDPAVIENNSLKIIQLEHHIVYSTSYQVPVLYFKALYQDGAPLSLKEIYQDIIPDMYHDQIIITQTEHPLIGSPFWFIHPCDTRKLMDTIQFKYENYIKTWLSFNGPIVKCSLSKDLFMIVN